MRVYFLIIPQMDYNIFDGDDDDTNNIKICFFHLFLQRVL